MNSILRDDVKYIDYGDADIYRETVKDYMSSYNGKLGTFWCRRLNTQPVPNLLRRISGDRYIVNSYKFDLHNTGVENSNTIAVPGVTYYDINDLERTDNTVYEYYMNSIKGLDSIQSVYKINHVVVGIDQSTMSSLIDSIPYEEVVASLNLFDGILYDDKFVTVALVVSNNDITNTYDITNSSYIESDGAVHKCNINEVLLRHNSRFTSDTMLQLSVVVAPNDESTIGYGLIHMYITTIFDT